MFRAKDKESGAGEAGLVGEDAVREQARVHDHRPGVLRQDARQRLLQVEAGAQLPVPARRPCIFCLRAWTPQ